MSKAVKQMEYSALERTFAGVRDLVLLSPSKIDSTTDYNFRKQLREKKVRVQMVKNSLVRRVFEAQGVKLDDKVWTGTTLVAWGADSIKDLSKAVDGLIKDIEKKDPKQKDKLKVKTAVADGQPIPMAKAMTMPTRLEAIGEVIGNAGGCLRGRRRPDRPGRPGGEPDRDPRQSKRRGPGRRAGGVTQRTTYRSYYARRPLQRHAP
jgi:ribosomal protein L10